jgi:hypothetical protein
VRMGMCGGRGRGKGLVPKYVERNITLFRVCLGYKCTLSALNDVGTQINITKLLHSIFNIFPTFLLRHILPEDFSTVMLRALGVTHPASYSRWTLDST